MSYQLDWLQTLEVIFIGDSWMWTALSLIPIYILINLRSSGRIVKIIMSIFLGLSLYTDLAIWRSGWQINGEKMYFKAQFYSAYIDVPSSNIGFVSRDSQWWPEWRNIGANLPRLSIGKYHMRNQASALLFNYQNQSELLLISFDGQYYLIGYPGIEILYDKLISLGAKEKRFESR